MSKTKIELGNFKEVNNDNKIEDLQIKLVQLQMYGLKKKSKLCTFQANKNYVNYVYWESLVYQE